MRAFQLITIGTLMNFCMTSAVYAGQSKLEKQREEQGMEDPALSAEMEEVAQMLESAGKECDKAPAEEVKIDEAQKSQIKFAVEEFKKDTEDLRARVKDSFELLVSTIKDSNSTLAIAQAAVENLEMAKMNLHEEAVKLKLNILYNILTPQQRPIVFSCMMKKHAHQQPAP